ncbi:MAG: hypothetical protein ABEJ24_00150, partial [Candidatus Magasanikbacteria bacterium]
MSNRFSKTILIFSLFYFLFLPDITYSAGFCYCKIPEKNSTIRSTKKVRNCTQGKKNMRKYAQKRFVIDFSLVDCKMYASKNKRKEYSEWLKNKSKEMKKCFCTSGPDNKKNINKIDLSDVNQCNGNKVTIQNQDFFNCYKFKTKNRYRKKLQTIFGKKDDKDQKKGAKHPTFSIPNASMLDKFKVKGPSQAVGRVIKILLQVVGTVGLV